MASVKSVTLKWGLLFFCLILGTWLGIFLQQFTPVAKFFSNVVDFAIDIKQIDLVMLKFGFNFVLKLNLGTLLGGLIGVWAAR